MKKSLFLLFIIIGFSNLQSQNKSTYIIKGKVINILTNQNIPYCNISTYEQGTSTNKDGEFIIKVNKFPVNLIVSHINFETKNIIIKSPQDYLKVELKENQRILKEVSVDNKNNNQAIRLIKKAYKKIKSDYQKKHASAFYRQTTKNSNDYYEFSEIFFDVEYNRNGILDWSLNQGRYALKNEYINNKNFTFFFKLIKSIQPDTDELIFPLHPNLEEYYTVQISEIIKSKDKDIAVIWLKPKKVDTPIFNGELYIDTKNYDLLKINGEIESDNLGLIKVNSKNSTYKNYKLNYDVNFKKDINDRLVLDYIKVNQNFDYIKENSPKQEISTKAILTFYEYKKKDKLKNKYKNHKGDWKQLDKIEYDEKFWKDNPIVKRTPIERKVIEDFEKEKSFDQLFINSRKQIAIQQSSIKNDLFIKELDSLTINYNRNNILEKIYLQTNKEKFNLGDTVSFYGYHINGSNHKPIFNSNVYYIDLISVNDKKSVFRKTGKTVNSILKGSLKLPHHLKGGKYILLAYTNWMRNFKPNFYFRKNIDIGTQLHSTSLSKKDNTINLSFKPEGGKIICDKNNRVAFKAVNSKGTPINVNGKIVNSKGKEVLSFSSKFQGSGYFNLKPLKNENYYAILTNDKKYSLPKTHNDGYILSVNNINNNTLKIRIEATKKFIDDEFYLLGHMFRDRYYQGKFSFGNKGIIDVEIPTKKLPSGVLILNILNKDKKMMAERAVFINNANNLVINSKINSKKIENEKSKLILNSKAIGLNNSPILSNLSYKVISNDYNKNSRNILSYLLLESEIEDDIINPNSFLNNNSRSTKSKIDLLLMSNNYRKYNWDTLTKSNLNFKKFNRENNFNTKGLVKNFNNQILKNCDIKVISKSNNNFFQYELKTDNNGLFNSRDINYNGKTQLVFHAKINNKWNNQIRVKLNDFLPNMDSKFNFLFFKDNSTNNSSFNYKSNSNTKKNSNKLDKIHEKNEVLDEVLLTGKISNKKNKQSLYNLNVKKSHILDQKDIKNATSITEIITKIPGATVRGDALRPKIYLNNTQAPPLFILDGVQINMGQPIVNILLGEDFGDNKNGYASPLVTMDLSSIERIEVIRDNNSALFGTRAMGGVILMYSKRGSNNLKSKQQKPLANLSLDYFVDDDLINFSSSILYSKKHSHKITTNNKNNTTIFIEGLSNNGLVGYKIINNF